MENFKKKLICKFDYSFSFKEKKAVYDHWEQVEQQAADTALKLFDGASNLAIKVTGLLGKGVDLIDKGLTLAESAGGKLIDRIQNPGKPLPLPEYKALTDPKNPNYIARAVSTGNANLDLALDAYRRMVFLGVLMKEANDFQQPFLTEFAKVEEERKARYDRQNKSPLFQDNGLDKIKKLEAKISGEEAVLNSGRLEKNHPDRLRIARELVIDKAELAKQQDYCSDIVEFDKPQYQKTEFPPGSKHFVDRFVLNTKQKITTDVREYYRWLATSGDQLSGDLAKYEKEIEKLDYFSKKLLEVLAADPKNAAAIEKLKIQRNFLQNAGNTIKRAMGPYKFAKQGAETDIYGPKFTDKAAIQSDAQARRKALSNYNQL